MSMIKLPWLPKEIRLMIAENCQLRDISSLARTCKQLYEPSIMALYSTASARNIRRALFFGILRGLPVTVTSALAAGADVNELSCDVEQVCAFLRCFEPQGLGPWVNCMHDEDRIIWSCSPLHLAARKGNVEVFEILIAHNASLSTTSVAICKCQNINDHVPPYLRMKTSVLHVALCCGHIPIAELLLAKDATLKNSIGFGPQKMRHGSELISMKEWWITDLSTQS